MKGYAYLWTKEGIASNTVCTVNSQGQLRHMLEFQGIAYFWQTQHQKSNIRIITPIKSRDIDWTRRRTHWVGALRHAV
jgi:hypothetical protein